MSAAPTVLVAEDSKTVRAQIVELLQSLDYHVREVSNGAAAIQAIGSHPDIRIALVDWNMPLVNGIEVCRYARSCQRFIHVIMLTSRLSRGDLACALENGANDYVRKPFDSDELSARVRSARTMCELQDVLLEAQSLETLGQLAAGIAHEINSPIQFVGDNLRFFEEVWQDFTGLLEAFQALTHSLAKEATPDPSSLAALARAIKQADLPYLVAEVPRALDQAKDGVGRISRIIRAMKDFGQIRSTEKVAANLNAAIESTIVLTRNEWKYVADVDLDLCTDLPAVECDLGAINQVVLNLVVNAAHSIGDARSTTPGKDESDAGSKGHIVVRTRALDEEVEIVVEDDGPGVPEEIRSRIFERFFTTKPVGKGTGQGLAITREIIEKGHGGRVTCENRTEGGARFSVRIPTLACSGLDQDTAPDLGPTSRP